MYVYLHDIIPYWSIIVHICPYYSDIQCIQYIIVFYAILSNMRYSNIMFHLNDPFELSMRMSRLQKGLCLGFFGESGMENTGPNMAK